MASLQLKSLMLGVLFSLVLLPVIVCQKCPNECICKHKMNSTYAICEVNSINSLDSIDLQPEYTTVLHLRCKEDSLSPNSLKPRMFQKLFRLMSIILQGCSFSHIDEAAFAGLNSFEDLLIFTSVNLTFPPNFFHHIRDLKQLVISNTDWQILSFDNLCILNNLRSLMIIKNPIEDIVENSTFCPGNNNSFGQLKKLILLYNEIRILRTGFSKRFQSLQYLTFGENKIDEIQNGSLVDLPQLEYLNIGQNYLQQLPDDFCAGCSELWHLIISSNPITEIPASFTKLRNLGKIQAKNTLLSDISIFTKFPLSYLNVANSSVKTIPSPFCENYSTISKLYLARNQIEDIPANTFENCSDLIYLDLSRNSITSLNEKSFSGLQSITSLSLSYNNMSRIGHATFYTLNNMIVLDLGFNFLTKLPVFPYTVMTIMLMGNQLREVNFSESPNLFMTKVLFLNKNQIEIIKNKAFGKCINLVKLNLAENNMRHLEDFAFYDLEYLLYLIIATNNIEQLNSALKPLIRLKELEAQHNRLSTLNRNMFPRSIKLINLSNNKIKTIEEGTFENLKDLEMVDLRWNKLVSLDSSSMKLNPNIMAVTNFSVLGNPLKCDCHLASLKNNSVNKYPIFTDLAPSECLQRDIYYLETATFNSSDQKQFVCVYKRNSLFNLPFSCYLNCQCCLTENCLCQHKVTESCLLTFRYDLTELRVDCKNGNLTDGTDIPHNATVIDLSANDLGYLTNETFRRQTMAEILYLNHSKITGIGERTFITFNTLMALHMEYNDIRILDSSGLLGLRKLKRLILNHNTIERILPGTFNVAPSLEVLDLSHNNLRKIDSQTFNVDSLKTIVLFENPWSCACQDLESLRQLLVTRLSEIESHTLLCDQRHIPVLEYDIDFCRNKSLNSTFQVQSPVRDTRLVYGLSIGMTLIVFAFIAYSILYVYRREIQILLFVRFGWRILSKKNQLDEEDKTYDAFVSYHNSQDAFVVNEMLPRLEEGTGPAYKLCVHFRDFPVGAPIVDNIIDSIENSKRTIILLTNQFLTSEWCRYEFQAAHLESLSNKMNSLVLVLLEDVNPDLVDGELKLNMKTKNNLRYDDPRFWDKLRFALPEKNQRTTNNDIELKPNSTSHFNSVS